MKNDLKPGDTLTLDGVNYEVKLISESGRICIAYVLDAAFERIPHPDDLTGDIFKETAFSDTRYYKNLLL